MGCEGNRRLHPCDAFFRVLSAGPRTDLSCGWALVRRNVRVCVGECLHLGSTWLIAIDSDHSVRPGARFNRVAGLFLFTQFAGSRRDGIAGGEVVEPGEVIRPAGTWRSV